MVEKAPFRAKLTWTGSILCLGLACAAIPASAQETNRAAAGADYTEALRLFHTGDYNGTLAALDRLPEEESSRSGVLNLRGAAYTRQENWARAAEMFTGALDADPTLVEARFNLAEVRFNEGEYVLAHKEYKAFLKVKDEHGMARYRLLLCLIMTGQMDEAGDWLKTFDVKKPDPSYYYAQAAWAFHHARVEKGRYFVAAAEQMYPLRTRIFYLNTLADLGWILPSQVR